MLIKMNATHKKYLLCCEGSYEEIKFPIISDCPLHISMFSRASKIYNKEVKKLLLKIMPTLSSEEKDALRASIQQEGVRVPIVKDELGNILDGHHRYEIAPDDPKCNGEAKIITGLTSAEKEAYAITSNEVRRNMSPNQKKELQKAKKKLAIRLRTEDPVKNTNAVVGAKLGVHEATVSRWLQNHVTNLQCKIVYTRNQDNRAQVTEPFKPDARVKVNPKQHEDIYQQIEEDNETYEQVAANYGVTRQQISSIYSKVKSKIEDQEAIKKASQSYNDNSDKCKIITGDFYEVCKSEIEPESIDHIITDPPYPKEYLPLWGKLSETAYRVLKPGGFLITYSGQYHLPEVIEYLSSHLEFYWQFILLHQGSKSCVHPARINVCYKPILVFYKPPRIPQNEYIDDVIIGTGREKNLIDWQQAEDELKPLIDAFTKPNDLILDPFAGSGTTLAASLKMGRRVVGIDIEEDCVLKIKGRVADLLPMNNPSLKEEELEALLV